MELDGSLLNDPTRTSTSILCCGIGPFRNREQRIGPQPIAPDLAKFVRAFEAELIVQLVSSKFWADLGELRQLRSDVGLQDLLHRMCFHAEFGRHQRRDPCRPVDPGITLLAR